MPPLYCLDHCHPPFTSTLYLSSKLFDTVLKSAQFEGGDEQHIAQDWLSDLVTISRYVKKKEPCLLSIYLATDVQISIARADDYFRGRVLRANDRSGSRCEIRIGGDRSRFTLVNPASRYIRMRTFFDVYNGDDLGLSIGTTRILRNEIVHAPFNDFGWEYAR
ncbi:hypothetical protein IW262DRAFT_1300078 [Armillaria fumosa]|nr:hypothetical protein IW262DRAFT_1300078 [Armillaria fumosa]